MPDVYVDLQRGPQAAQNFLYAEIAAPSDTNTYYLSTPLGLANHRVSLYDILRGETIPTDPSALINLNRAFDVALYFRPAPKDMPNYVLSSGGQVKIVISYPNQPLVPINTQEVWWLALSSGCFFSYRPYVFNVAFAYQAIFKMTFSAPISQSSPCRILVQPRGLHRLLVRYE